MILRCEKKTSPIQIRAAIREIEIKKKRKWKPFQCVHLYVKSSQQCVFFLANTFIFISFPFSSTTCFIIHVLNTVLIRFWYTVKMAQFFNLLQIRSNLVDSIFFLGISFHFVLLQYNTSKADEQLAFA